MSQVTVPLAPTGVSLPAPVSMMCIPLWNSSIGSSLCYSSSSSSSLRSRCLLRHSQLCLGSSGDLPVSKLSLSAIMLISVMVLAFSFQVPICLQYSLVGAQSLGFAMPQPYWVISLQAYVPPGDGAWSIPAMHRVAAPSTTLSCRECHASHSPVPQPFHQYDQMYSFGGLIPLPSLNGGEGSSLTGCVPLSDMVNSQSVEGV